MGWIFTSKERLLRANLQVLVYKYLACPTND